MFSKSFMAREVLPKRCCWPGPKSDISGRPLVETHLKAPFHSDQMLPSQSTTWIRQPCRCPRKPVRFFLGNSNRAKSEKEKKIHRRQTKKNGRAAPKILVEQPLDSLAPLARQRQRLSCPGGSQQLRFFNGILCSGPA